MVFMDSLFRRYKLLLLFMCLFFGSTFYGCYQTSLGTAPPLVGEKIRYSNSDIEQLLGEPSNSSDLHYFVFTENMRKNITDIVSDHLYAFPGYKYSKLEKKCYTLEQHRVFSTVLTHACLEINAFGPLMTTQEKTVATYSRSQDFDTYYFDISCDNEKDSCVESIQDGCGYDCPNFYHGFVLNLIPKSVTDYIFGALKENADIKKANLFHDKEYSFSFVEPERQEHQYIYSWSYDWKNPGILFNIIYDKREDSYSLISAKFDLATARLEVGEPSEESTILVN